jgi:hypothetical protein
VHTKSPTIPAIRRYFFACPTARLRADASDANVWSQRERHLASPRLTVKFFTRRPLGKALLILSRRVVIRSAYSIRVFASMALFACRQPQPFGRRNIDTALGNACRESRNINLAQSQYIAGAVRLSKVKPGSLRDFHRTETLRWLAEHALRLSRDADHRTLYSGPARHSFLGQSSSIISLCESVAWVPVDVLPVLVETAVLGVTYSCAS